MTALAHISAESPAVQAHLGIVQAVIQRMAANSASAKSWCIALNSAILVFVVERRDARFAWVAALATLLFLALDTYYLALEKGFRNAYNEFIDKLHRDALVSADLYAVQPSGSPWDLFSHAALSLSILPFYLTLFGASVVIAKYS